MDNIKQFLEADALLQAARGDDYGKAYIAMRDAAMDIAPDIRQLLAAFEQVCEALEDSVVHMMNLERELDILHGLGNDAGAGSGLCVCKARQTLARLKPYEKLFEKEGGE